MLDFIYTVDYAVLNFIQEHLANPFFDFFFSLYTHLGDAGIFMMIAAAVCLCFKKTRKAGVVMAIALMIGTLCTNIVIKPLVGRIRPYDNLAREPLRLAGDLLIKAPTDPSFPSGHTTAAFETAFAVFLCNKKWGTVSLAAAVLLAYSRLYLYVHYFSDILGGIVIGILAAVAAWFIVRAFWNKLPAKITGEAVLPPAEKEKAE